MAVHLLGTLFAIHNIDIAIPHTISTMHAIIKYAPLPALLGIVICPYLNFYLV